MVAVISLTVIAWTYRHSTRARSRTDSSRSVASTSIRESSKPAEEPTSCKGVSLLRALAILKREGPAREVAEKYGVSRVALYRWKNELLGKERPVTKQERRKSIDSDDKDVLLAKVESLKEQVKTLEKQVYRLRLEKDVLEVTAELLKKARAPIPRN